MYRYYQVIMMIDIFQYSNMYTVKPAIQKMSRDESVSEECGLYVTRPGTSCGAKDLYIADLSQTTSAHRGPSFSNSTRPFDRALPFTNGQSTTRKPFVGSISDALSHSASSRDSFGAFIGGRSWRSR